MSVGSAGRIVAFSEMDDGRLMISLRAVSRFRLIEQRPGFSPYLRGAVDWLVKRGKPAPKPASDPKADNTEK